MSPDKLLHFRDVLLERRQDILIRVRELETRWRETTEPAIEPEEDAQMAAITLPYDRLDENVKGTIEQIDLALNKIQIGEYGICESCGDEITTKRLEAVPWARQCIDCARDFERTQQQLPPAAELIEASELPDEYQGLSNNQILGLINEQIEKDGRLDTEELDISLRGGVLYLEGTIAAEPEHQILMQLLTDVLGFSAIVDHLAINEVVFERSDRTSGKRQPSESTLEGQLFYDEEELSEDLFEAGDEKPYHPPENPPPQQEYPEKRDHFDKTI